jgi:hypothetical protein
VWLGRHERPQRLPGEETARHDDGSPPTRVTHSA